jgi:predicted DNA-binding transcriptional regulator AlpA
MMERIEHSKRTREGRAAKLSSSEAERRARQRYVDTRVAAAFLGVSESFLNKARHFGTGPEYVRFGRAIRYDLDELESWARARSVSAARAAESE